jgi:hypothetical protein
MSEAWMTKKSTERLPPARRSTTGLRDALFDEIDRIRSGTGNLLEAGAIARLAQQIVNVTRVEMEYAQSAERFANMTTPREIMLSHDKSE